MSMFEDLMVTCECCKKEYLGDPKYVIRNQDDVTTDKCLCEKCWQKNVLEKEITKINYRTEPPSFSSFGTVICRYFDSEDDLDNYLFSKDYLKEYKNYKKYRLDVNGQLFLVSPNHSKYISTGAFYPKNIISPISLKELDDMEMIRIW